MKLSCLIAEQAILRGKQPAWYRWQNESLQWTDWRSIYEAVQYQADLLRSDCRPGDRLLSSLANGLEWAILDLACSLADVIHSPIDPRYRSSHLHYFQELVQPSRTILNASEVPLTVRWYSVTPNQDLETTTEAIDVAWKHASTSAATILFTSGTSSKPRGVALSHRNLISNALAKLDAVPQMSSDRRLNLLPFAHAYARTCELTTWLISGSSLLSVSNLDEAFFIAPKFEPTLFNAVPYIFEKIRQRLEDTDSTKLQEKLQLLLGKRIRCLASGGAGLSSDLFRYFSALGYPIVQGYGMTEASPVICSNRSGNPIDASVGLPVSDVELRVNREGRLFARGPGVMLGYWNDPLATQLRVRDRWLDTGDRAQLNADGSVQILGRIDDTIVLKTGLKVEPQAIERSLETMEVIDRAVLIGNNEKFVAVIISTRDPERSSLLNEIQQHLAAEPEHAIPKKLIISDVAWTIDNGLINPKGATARMRVVEAHRDAIEECYLRSSLGRRKKSLKPSDADQ